MARTIATLVVFTLLAGGAAAQEKPTPAPTAANSDPAGVEVLRLAEGEAPTPAKIADLAWLAGYWRGTGLGGRCEEVWGQPHGDRMHGFFHLANEQGAVFSEAMLLVEEEGSVVMKIRHFDPKFIAWEEKDDYVTFRLVRLGPNTATTGASGRQEAFFSGLTVRREGDRLWIFLRFKSDAGSRIETFDFQRVTS